MKIVLTIAGSDSICGAGIQQDLKVFSAMNVHGVSVITAVTSQNTRRIISIHTIPEDIISDQIDTVFSDLQPDAVKTGMLYSSETADIVRKKMREYRIKNLVVDPILKSGTGAKLLQDDAIEELKRLMKMAKLSTPNIYEAEVLSGVKIKNLNDMKKAAKKIGNCLITGGHLNAVDVLYSNGEYHYFKNPEGKLTVKLHGTGCTLSAAITAELANGKNLITSIQNAKEFTTELIKNSIPIGHGANILDPTLYYKKLELKENVKKAIELFVSEEKSYLLVPQVGINIVMALENPETINDIAGITGRIIRNKNRVIPVGNVEFEGSKHVATVVLSAVKFNPEMRAAMNIKYSDEIVKICKKIGFKVSSFDRRKEPKKVSTMEWGTITAIEKVGYVPDIIFDKGSIGKEAMIRILGKNTTEVVEKSIKIMAQLT